MKYSREYFIAQFPFISTRDNHFLCNDHAHELHYIIDFASFTRDITFVPKHKLKRFLNLFQARVCKFQNEYVNFIIVIDLKTIFFILTSFFLKF